MAVEAMDFRFPFPVPASSLVDEFEGDFIDLPSMMDRTDRQFGNGRKTSELKNVLTLRKDHLVCWRSESSDTVFDEQEFGIVRVAPGDETLGVPDEYDNVVYLFMEDFIWNPIDSHDGYKPSKDEGYLEVSYKSTDFVSLFITCVDLSYRYGTKFMFWNMHEVDNGEHLFLITLDKECSKRNAILSDIEKNVKNLRCKNITKVKVYKDGPKFNVPVKPAPSFEDDFE